MDEDIEKEVGPLLDAVSILVFSGKAEPAIELLNRAVNRHPGNEWVVGMAILNCFGVGKYDVARKFHQIFQKTTGKPVESFNASLEEIRMAESERKEQQADFQRSKQILLRSFPLFWRSTVLEAQENGLRIKKGGREAFIPWEKVKARVSLNATHYDHVDREISLTLEDEEISFKADLSISGKECLFYECIQQHVSVLGEDEIRLSFNITAEKDKLVVAHLKEFVALQTIPDK